MGFISDNFLLRNKKSEELYFRFAEKQPIIDYHNHLSAKLIYENHIFSNLTQAWLDGDHYKWRAMRTFGIEEKYLTGKATDEEKFSAWAKTLPNTIRNPLFHWSQLELKRYFDIDDYLNEKSAAKIYEDASNKLHSPDFGAKGLLDKMNVVYVCTTEDPTDNLEYHKLLKNNSFPVHSAFRPDKAINIDDEHYLDYLIKLGQASNIEINNFNALRDALVSRVEFFQTIGTRISDHGLSFISYAEGTDADIESILKKRLDGKELSNIEIAQFKTAVMLFLSKEYHKRGWVQQFHLGALRNNNQRKLDQLGPDTGWDSIGDYSQAEHLSKFFNALDKDNTLCKSIIYNLNPSDNAVFATMTGNFNDGSVQGKIQFGSGWWFMDQKDGMTQQLNALSNMSLLSCFIGMLTDSRSFLSFPRHEYFRRILCNILGEEMESGEIPDDMDLVGSIVEKVCYTNAKNYFSI